MSLADLRAAHPYPLEFAVPSDLQVYVGYRAVTLRAVLERTAVVEGRDCEDRYLVSLGAVRVKEGVLSPFMPRVKGKMRAAARNGGPNGRATMLARRNAA